MDLKTSVRALDLGVYYRGVTFFVCWNIDGIHEGSGRLFL